jgi:hypothetical protein
LVCQGCPAGASKGRATVASSHILLTDVLGLSTRELDPISEIMLLEMAKIAHFSTGTKLKLLQIYQSYFNWAKIMKRS